MPNPTPAPLKPGYQTTEFWTTLAQTLVSAVISIMTLLNPTLAANLSANSAAMAIVLAWILASVASVLRYTAARTDLKRAAIYRPGPAL